MLGKNNGNISRQKKNEKMTYPLNVVELQHLSMVARAESQPSGEKNHQIAHPS